LKSIAFDKIYKDLRILILSGSRGMLELLPKLTRWEKITLHIPLKHSCFNIYIIHKLKSRSLTCCSKFFQNLIVLLSIKKNTVMLIIKNKRNWKRCCSQSFLKWRYVRVVRNSTNRVCDHRQDFKQSVTFQVQWATHYLTNDHCQDFKA
jgi:hypothetical protein